MTHPTAKHARKWIKPTAAGGSIVTLLAVLGAKYSTLRSDVDTLQTTKPDVTAARVDALERDARDTRQREERDLRSINDALRQLGQDVSWIRGKLELPARGSAGEGATDAKVAGSFRQVGAAARG